MRLGHVRLHGLDQRPLVGRPDLDVAAGIEVGKLGAASVSRQELLEYVDTHVLHV